MSAAKEGAFSRSFFGSVASCIGKGLEYEGSGFHEIDNINKIIDIIDE